MGKKSEGGYKPATPGLQKKINRTVKQAKKDQTQPAIRLREYDDAGKEIGENDVRGNSFPGQYIPADARDTEMAFRKRLLEKDPWTGEKVKLVDTITDADKKYMKDKQAQQDYLNRLEYQRSTINQTDPTAMAIQRMKGLTKQQDEAERKAIEDAAEVSKRVALIRQGGVAGLTQDDIDFMFKVDAGIIQLPRGPIWDPASYKYAGDKDATWADQRSRGMFNPKKLFPQMVNTYMRKKNDPFPGIQRNQTLAKSVLGAGNSGGGSVLSVPGFDWPAGVSAEWMSHT